MVGIYSNYLLIQNAITRIISQIFEAITSSIGNLVATTNNEKSEDIFYKLQFLNFWLYTFLELAQSMGVFGVILTTVISRLFITDLYDPIIVFKYGFKKSSKEYFITYFKYFLLFNAISTILMYISTYFEINNYLLWIAAGIISSIVINLILFY